MSQDQPIDEHINPDPADLCHNHPEAVVLEELFLAARNGYDTEVARMIDTLHTELRVVPGLDEVTAAMLVARVADGKTIDEIAGRHRIRKDLVHRQLGLVKRGDLTRIRGCLLRNLLQINGGAIREQYRSGLDLGGVIDGLDLMRFGGPKEAVEKLIKKSGLLTTRDKTIHQVRRENELPVPKRKWSNTELNDGIRRVSSAACRGTAPRVEDYETFRRAEGEEHGSYRLASVPTVVNRRGSWNEALMAAGFDVKIRGHRSDKYWTSEACIEHMLRLVRDLDELPPVTRYDEIARKRPQQPDPKALPSSATARNELDRIGVGQWDSIRSLLVQRLLDTGVWED